MSYSKTIIMGRLTADPELRQTTNGVAVTSFSVAVDRPYTNKSGEKEVDFLNVVAWRGTAEFICRYFSKGRPILIDGSIQTRTYTDREGVERRAWEIVADQARFTESKGNHEPTSQQNNFSNGGADVFVEVENGDDLPF